MSQGGIERRGLMLVLSSPSGAGKTTISRALLARDGGLMLSISATTRPKRPGETEGVDYVFMDQARFDGMVRDGAFLEHATVFGHCHWAEDDYIVVNEEVEASVAAVGSILEAERLRRERRIGLHDFVEVLRRGS